MPAPVPTSSRAEWEDTSGDSLFVMDAKGFAYPLGGATAAAQLGFGSSDAPVVPDSWVELFDPGVELSENAALCAPRLGEKPCV